MSPKRMVDIDEDYRSTGSLTLANDVAYRFKS